MCGIVGAVSTRNIVPVLVEGLKRLEYRGYDSCGVAVHQDGGLRRTRSTSRVAELDAQVAAEKVDGGYRLNGRKIWTTGAQRANKILIIARTTPKDQCAKPTQGLSLFYTDREKIEAKPIPKMGRKAVECNMLFIEDLFVPAEDLVGEEGKGFQYLLHGLNPERVLFAVEAIGLGRAALAKATTYAKERVVFGRPIGQNQGVQFPIARAYAQMRAAELMVHEASRLYAEGENCGEEANISKMLAAEASWAAAEACVQTHGGFAFAEEYNIERKFRETRLYQVAPISTNLILSYIAEHVLGMPRSY